jgi:TolB-like protein/Flp pilus assembly protein TadD
VAVSSSPDDQYLAHGISETLIHQLAQVSDLRVIARTSSFSFIDTPNLDARSIGQSLGVASVLEGSVQRIGGKLRILTQMVNTETGTHVWSEQFDRDESDIFEIQDDIAKFVVEHLRQTIKTEASELPIGDVGTSNLEAYDEYLRGLDQLRLGSVESLPEAILHFNRAIDLDETFNQARLKLLETYRVQLKVGQIDYAELLVRNQTIPHEILKFEPDSAGALNYLAAADFSIYFPTGSGEAERLWARALDIAPRDPIILTHYAYYLSWNDKPNEAIANLELALEVDPYSSWTLGEAALNGSTQYADQLLQKYPDNPSGWDITAYLQLIRGDLVEAYRSYRQAERLSPYNHEFTTSIATVLMTAGLLEEAETELREAEAKGPGQISTISARIGLEYLKGNLDSAGQMALNALRNQLPPRMMGPIITQNIALQYALSSDQPLDYVDAIALWTGVPGRGSKRPAKPGN